MKSEEFDRRIEDEDIFDLLDDPKIVPVQSLKARNISFDISEKLYRRLEERAKKAGLKVEEFVKVILAERIGAL
jgi:hypothetical protein